MHRLAADRAAAALVDASYLEVRVSIKPLVLLFVQIAGPEIVAAYLPLRVKRSAARVAAKMHSSFEE